jgi:hypothetical protein
MNKLAMAALLLAGACGAAQAGGSASATMEVSFVVRAACSVQAGPSAASPQVECSQGTGYQLVRQPAPAAASAQPAPSSASQSGDTWQVVF